MFRKTAVAAAMLLIVASSNTRALGLGEIDMQSSLNQPMKAAIHLTSAGGTDLSQLKVDIASADAHRRAGLTKSRILGNFRFKVEQDKQGQPVIYISSTDTIQEPFLEFILELTWPNGRLMRQYTVLVDPPLTMPATPAIPATPVSSTPRATAIAAAPAAPRSAPSAYARPPAGRAAASRADSQPASSYGPVKRNETLWSIAKQIRPDSGITIEQMMLALQRANPNAFMGNNVNSLKAGVTLQIPSRDEIISVNAQDASAEFKRQMQEWKAAAAAAPAAATESAASPAAATAGGAPPGVVAESRLQLTAPEGEPVTGPASAGDPQTADTADGAGLEQQLSLANETAEANRAMSEELQSRVNELEGQVTTMKRLLELKSDELASMQDRQAAAEEPAAEPAIEAEAAEPPVVEETVTAAAAASADSQSPPRTEAWFLPGEMAKKLLDNPVLAGVGVLVTMLLGGILWATSRRKGKQNIFDDELTLEKRLAADKAPGSSKPSPVVAVSEPYQDAEQGAAADGEEGDPLTEADVYLAYGRLQQAEDVLLAALEKTPADVGMRMKLLEVYHTGGNTGAFDRAASELRETVTDEDPVWQKVAVMGRELSPGNELYQSAAHAKDNNLDFDIDLTAIDSADEHDGDTEIASRSDLGFDMEAREGPAETVRESIDFNLDDLEAADISYDDSEEDAEGLLDATDEVSTKLDLARAYLDMGDPEGARSILDEVLEEGNDAQKDEAGKLIAEIA